MFMDCFFPFLLGDVMDGAVEVRKKLRECLSVQLKQFREIFPLLFHALFKDKVGFPLHKCEVIVLGEKEGCVDPKLLWILRLVILALMFLLIFMAQLKDHLLILIIWQLLFQFHV